MRDATSLDFHTKANVPEADFDIAKDETEDSQVRVDISAKVPRLQQRRRCQGARGEERGEPASEMHRVVEGGKTETEGCRGRRVFKGPEDREKNGWEARWSYKSRR